MRLLGRGYDWRATEARLNQIPQFTTVIDGLDIHFLHVRSPHPGAVPLVMTHGWPGSFLEFERVLGPLTDPAAHGADAAAGVFDVVVPSWPGYGFSGKPVTAGWDIHRIARAWAELMTRLGYERFLAMGSDWGTLVSAQTVGPAVRLIYTRDTGSGGGVRSSSRPR
ncbi:MAG: epoxide hydrolase [Trebonia sp.]